MSNVTIQKRGNFYQYKFEIAKVDGKRKFLSKSGFKTKSEAEKEGVIAYNDYLNTGNSFSASDMSYSDFLDYWLENYCYINLKYHTIEGYSNIIKNHIKPNIIGLIVISSSLSSSKRVLQRYARKENDNMAYTILRFKKDKGGAIANCERHNETKKEAYKSNPDIDINKSKENYHIIQHHNTYTEEK